MSQITFDQLLDAGAHFGHLTRKWNPAMAPYIFMEQNGIHIIDLHKTVAKIDEACEALKKFAQEGKTVLFVATKRSAQESVARLCGEAGIPFVTERWLGGMLTNFPTIRKTVSKMDRIDRMKGEGVFDNLSKREKLQIDRQREKLEKNFGSIASMKTLPSAIFVIDSVREHIAVKEAHLLGIPVFAIADTNANPRDIDFLIPANDDSHDGIELIVAAACEAIKEGSQERKIQNTDNSGKEGDSEDESGEGRGRRRRRFSGVRRAMEEGDEKEADSSAEESEADNETETSTEE
ncbi:30S ribosomal protein S2 [uncultured Porphyromonas sp.]|uniref:30S ribosomal protein S2 n=1 Tax=uncultured Porphyromonas sp. TaxID=159274 RepID=UPI00260428BB|nr:30S ribosomal protein S2 [uncultured Porphyromonas sp.]